MNDVERRRLLPNATLAALQALMTGAILLLLYRYLLKVIGIEKVGLWSLVLGATSVANVGQLGLSGSALRFVSKHLAHDASERATEALQTAILSVAVVVGVIAVLVLPAGKWFLPLLLEGRALQQGLSLWPYAVLSLWLTSIGGALQSGLDGCHRADLRSISVIFASLLHLGAVLPLVHSYGVMGLAYAQIAQGLFVALLNWYWLRGSLPDLPALPWRWSALSFRQMWGYGLQLQATNILMMLTGPVVKALLVHFGSLATLGYFEMAGRMVTKVREVIVGGAQVVTPYFSKLTETDRKRGLEAYCLTCRVMAIIALPIIFSVALVSPAMSYVWFGVYEPTFVLYAWLLAGGYLANVLSAPAFFANLGSGAVRWNTLSHVLLTLLVIGTGWVLGRIWGGDGVVVAWVGSLGFVALFLVNEHQRRMGLKYSDILSGRDAGVIGSNVGFLVTAVALGYVLTTSLGVYITAFVQLGILSCSALVIFKVYGVIDVINKRRRRSVERVV